MTYKKRAEKLGLDLEKVKKHTSISYFKYQLLLKDFFEIIEEAVFEFPSDSLVKSFWAWVDAKFNKRKSWHQDIADILPLCVNG